MNDPDLQALERRLRTLPPLRDVPPSLVLPSVRAAIEDTGPAPRIRRAPRRSMRRWSFAGAAIAAAAAIAVTVTLTSQSGPQAGYQRNATLTGAGNASGEVSVGRATGAIEPVVVSIRHLQQAPADQYYEIWFQTGGQKVPGVAFNARSDGTAEVHLNAPTDTQWVRCWITRESVTHPGNGTIVMRASRT
jgi:hypothetical protein